jgi:hypothetical protein
MKEHELTLRMTSLAAIQDRSAFAFLVLGLDAERPPPSERPFDLERASNKRNTARTPISIVIPRSTRQAGRLTLQHPQSLIGPRSRQAWTGNGREES